MFKKVLIANRGEVALRIMRTCQDVGVQTVAVYSEADRLSPHVLYADEAYRIGPPPPKESYLNIAAVIQAAKDSGAEAIHPGYGFLAENPDFSDATRDAGLVFIGPTGDMIRNMGNKLSGRRMMQKAGVPIVPGATVQAKDLGRTKKLAKKMGYPIVVKPAGGGGGKGMHVVQKPAELEGALNLAASEAESAFGDPTVYIEKYLEKVRHVEVQMVRDIHGNVLHLGERECSVQRRHQKMIEECPSIAVDKKTREGLVKAATAAVNSVNYHGVGTVEFLLTPKRDFYFLEMNTRLQVEHTVTEQVTGLDLVEYQLLVASGAKLPHKQKDVHFNGWAVECRISAEDPYNGFMPCPGPIGALYEPGGPGVRVDSGVAEGFEIPIFYDPMIAKLITWGRTRDQAIRRMVRALTDYKILGVKNNIPFLLATLTHPKFIEGDLHTGFIDENVDLFEQRGENDPERAAIVAALVEHLSKSQVRVERAPQAVGAGSAWRAAGQSWEHRWR